MEEWSKCNLQPLADCFKRLFSTRLISSDQAERVIANIYREIEYGNEDVRSRYS